MSARIVDAAGRIATNGWIPCESNSLGANVVFTQTCKLTLDSTTERTQATLELNIVELMGGRSVEKFLLHLALR